MQLPVPKRVLVYGKPVDMRKSFDGLYELVGRCLEEDPTSGDLFLFIVNVALRTGLTSDFVNHRPHRRTCHRGGPESRGQLLDVVTRVGVHPL